MAATWKQAGKARSVPGGLAMAVSVSVLMTIVGSVVIALCLNEEKITWQQAGYWIMGMLLAASFVGGKCAYGAIKRQRLVVCVMSGLLYWGLLLCVTALFFGGKFGAVWETAGIIAAGSGTSALITMPGGGKNRRKTGRYYC